jgi:hypothetical protein
MEIKDGAEERIGWDWYRQVIAGGFLASFPRVF